MELAEILDILVNKRSMATDLFGTIFGGMTISLKNIFGLRLGAILNYGKLV